jgi:cell division protein ZipA
VAEFRWLLIAAGLIVLALVFWLGRREARGERFRPPSLVRSREPRLEAGEQSAAADDGGPLSRPVTAERIITVRLMARAHGSFPGEELLAALEEAGLRHGRFGIFHRHGSAGDEHAIFSVASLVEPGTFDLAQVKGGRYPGVSLFLTLPAMGDAISAFDDMMATARSLATRLEGELLDEKGSRLSVQRERYLREEIIQFQHEKATTPDR